MEQMYQPQGMGIRESRWVRYCDCNMGVTVSSIPAVPGERQLLPPASLLLGLHLLAQLWELQSQQLQGSPRDVMGDSVESLAAQAWALSLH